MYAITLIIFAFLFSKNALAPPNSANNTTKPAEHQVRYFNVIPVYAKSKCAKPPIEVEIPIAIKKAVQFLETELFNLNNLTLKKKQTMATKISVRKVVGSWNSSPSKYIIGLSKQTN